MKRSALPPTHLPPPLPPFPSLCSPLHGRLLSLLLLALDLLGLLDRLGLERPREEGLSVGVLDLNRALHALRGEEGRRGGEADGAGLGDGEREEDLGGEVRRAVGRAVQG